MQNPIPLVSVVVPLYNKRHYILRCLDSISRQTMSDFEVIVVDDGSQDGGGILAQHVQDPRMRVVRQTNRGVGAARNRGILESAGNLIAFLDADDSWEPQFLEAVVSLASRYPQAGIYATGYRKLFAHRKARDTTIADPGKDGARVLEDYFLAAQEGHLITSSSVAIRRAVLNEVGPFLENEPMGEDLDLWARICLRYPVAFDARILAVYHMESQGRAVDHWKPTAFTPLPVVRYLRRQLLTAGVSRAMHESVRTYIDCVLIEHAYSLVWRQEQEQLREFLKTETFMTPKFRKRARLLDLGIRLLPFRLIAALKWKPEHLVQWWRHTFLGRSRFGSGRRFLMIRDGGEPHGGGQ